MAKTDKDDPTYNDGTVNRSPNRQRKINYDRGVTYRLTPEGISVYVYKDEPCTFFNAHGTEVTKDFAARAGFDIPSFDKKCLRIQLQLKAHADIEAQLADEAQRKVVVERNGFVVIDLGHGRHQILDPDGQPLHKEVLPAEMALKLFDDLVPVPKADAK